MPAREEAIEELTTLLKDPQLPSEKFVEIVRRVQILKSMDN